MSVSRAFLQPKSVDKPPQGDFSYKPVFLVFEDTSALGLQAQMSGSAATQANSTTHYYVVEQIEYAVAQTPPPMTTMTYSAMVWLTEVEKV